MIAYTNTPQAQTPVTRREVASPVRKPDEVLIEVKAFAINRGELSLLETRPEGWQPGQDVTGIVLAAPDNSSFGTGMPVAALAEQGGWAEQVSVAENHVAALPEGLDLMLAAGLPMVGHTALRLVRLAGSLIGKRVLVTGASGGVGSVAVQLARQGGAEVTGVSKVDGSVEGTFDVILESVGGDSLAQALERIAPHGTVLVFGNSSREPTPFSFSDFFGQEGIKLQTFFSYDANMCETVREDLGTLLTLLADKRLELPIGFADSWQKLPDALEALRNRRFKGKAVLRID